MHNILVPIGVSKYAKTTLLYAIDVARHFESTVYVIDAYPAFSTLATITNVSSKLQSENISRIKKMVASATTEVDKIKFVSSEQDLIGAIKKLDQTIGIDLIVTATLNNDINHDIFLGKIAGSLIKRTKIPVLVAPVESTFEAPKKMLLAFKTGEVKATSTLNSLVLFQDHFKAKLKLLLVKVPGFAHRNHQLDDGLMQRAEQLLFSSNATVYQGVLEHFQEHKPDMLVAFKRERGFFEKLWETDIIFKKDFYCTVPLLVLKNKD
jgi:nucleotide-binding universal stress UspA family protein